MKYGGVATFTLFATERPFNLDEKCFDIRVAAAESIVKCKIRLSLSDSSSVNPNTRFQQLEVLRKNVIISNTEIY